jgi:hypothetical protein
MPPKGGKGKKAAGKTKTGLESAYLVRTESPLMEAMPSPKEVKDKYMISEADMMGWRAVAEDKKVDEASEAFVGAKGVMYSAWWATSQILLPTNAHFPGKQNKNATLSVEANMGLIRPVSTESLENLKAAFEEHGNMYDAGHPVYFTYSTHDVHVLVFLYYLCDQQCFCWNASYLTDRFGSVHTSRTRRMYAPPTSATKAHSG